MKKIQILLSTYNGESYLPQLLESLSFQENVNLELLVRDDGSKDNTVQILNDYGNRNANTRILLGENIGYLKSFWKLIETAEGADYYALCDQDDYWLSDKMYEAVKVLDKYKDKPALYTSNVIPVDSNLKELNVIPFETDGVLDLSEVLKRSPLPGCTFVFNNLLLEKLKEYKGYMIIHDWIIYLIATLLGVVVYDEVSHIKYRLHGDNACGSEIGLEGFKKKFKRFLENKTPNARTKVAMDIIKQFESEIGKEDFMLLSKFVKCNNAKFLIDLMKYKCFRDPIFITSAILHRV